MAERDVQRAEEAREELNSVDKATVRVGCCLDLLAWASRSGGQAAGCRSPEGEEQGPPIRRSLSYGHTANAAGHRLADRISSVLA